LLYTQLSLVRNNFKVKHKRAEKEVFQAKMSTQNTSAKTVEEQWSRNSKN